MGRQNPYEILGVSKDASYAEIRKAFKNLALQYHPDKTQNENQKAEMAKRFIAVHEAYLQLTSNNSSNNETKYLEGAPLLIADHIEQYENLCDLNYVAFDNKNFLNQEKFAFDFSDFKKDNFKKDYFKKGNFDILIKKQRQLLYQDHYLESLTTENIYLELDQARHRYKDIGKNPDEYSYLWIAQKKGCGPIYLFNTMHVMLPAMARFKDVLENMIEKSDVVFTEIALSETSDSTLPIDYPTLDSYIANRADQMKKILRPLENEAVRNCFGANIDDKVVDLLIKYIKQLKLDYQNNPDLFEMKILQSMLGQEDTSDDFLESIKDRNLFWMSSILRSSSIEKNATFVACGALHTGGKFGLANLLRHEGYEVKASMKKPPVLTENALREALAQHGLLSAKPERKLSLPSNKPTHKK